jgi:hypothetical protein
MSLVIVILWEYVYCRELNRYTTGGKLFCFAFAQGWVSFLQSGSGQSTELSVFTGFPRDIHFENAYGRIKASIFCVGEIKLTEQHFPFVIK